MRHHRFSPMTADRVRVPRRKQQAGMRHHPSPPTTADRVRVPRRKQEPR
ncbi:hypothetical protein GCM10010470_52800 [Saccharopolyspora taberi]|uniref:Uncharacterized protein n=1 Tax=Saccharopolyspora taberi TaxID=60895 RepID=A0ABN3VLG0_9PSEU